MIILHLIFNYLLSLASHPKDKLACTPSSSSYSDRQHSPGLCSAWRYSPSRRPEKCGSYSIESVLPAGFLDDPDLDYHNLEAVHNGAEAMRIFPQIQYLEP